MRLRGRVLLLCLCLVGCTMLSRGGLPRGTNPVVKIGLVAPFEGRYRSLGYEVLYAVKWAVRQRNEAGGVAGYMVELVALDDSDDPIWSALQARKLVVDPDVMGVVGPFSEATILAAGPLYQELGLAAISPATCIPKFTAEGEGSFFCLGASVDTLSRALVERLPDKAQVTLLRTPDGVMGDALVSAAQQVVWTAQDGAWSSEEALDAMRAHTSHVYLYDGHVLSAAGLLTEMRKGGIGAPLWGGPSLARVQLVQIAGEAVDGACYAVTASLYADPAPPGAFATGYRELSGGAQPGPWAALAYDATVLLLEALGRAIEAEVQPTRQGVIAQLASARSPDGELVFAGSQRRRAETVLYCYERGDPYPGRLVEWGQ